MRQFIWMWFTPFLMENYTLTQEPKHWFHQRISGRAAKTLRWFEACSWSLVSHWGPAAIFWTGLSEGIWEVLFTFGQTVQCCRFELIYFLKKLKFMSQRKASSAEFNSVWRAQVRPFRPKFTLTVMHDAKTQMPCQEFLLTWSSVLSLLSSSSSAASGI